MPNLSNNRITFSRRPIDFAIGVHDSQKDASDSRSRFNIKAVQRRAFDRGVSVEREKYSQSIRQMVDQISVFSGEMRAAVENDRRQIEEFAVRLALRVAEDLCRTVIDKNEHDVVRMVRDLMSEIDERTAASGLVLRLNPADHTALLEAAANAEISLGDIEVVADAETPVASPRLVGGDTEYYTHLGERLQQIREAMCEEARHVSS